MKIHLMQMPVQLLVVSSRQKRLANFRRQRKQSSEDRMAFSYHSLVHESQDANVPAQLRGREIERQVSILFTDIQFSQEGFLHVVDFSQQMI